MLHKLCIRFILIFHTRHNILKILLSFIANDPNCLGRSNGYYWEFTNPDSSSSSNCLFDREINGTHVIYKTTVESKLPKAEISPLITRSRNLIMDFTCSLEVSPSGSWSPGRKVPSLFEAVFETFLNSFC